MTGLEVVAALVASSPRFCQRNFHLILRPFHGSIALAVKIRLAVFHSEPVARVGAGGERGAESGEIWWPGGENCGCIRAVEGAW